MKGGQGKDAKGVTAIRQVAGANLAFIPHLNPDFCVLDGACG